MVSEPAMDDRRTTKDAMAVLAEHRVWTQKALETVNHRLQKMERQQVEAATRIEAFFTEQRLIATILYEFRQLSQIPTLNADVMERTGLETVNPLPRLMQDNQPCLRREEVDKKGNNLNAVGDVHAFQQNLGGADDGVEEHRLGINGMFVGFSQDHNITLSSETMNQGKPLTPAVSIEPSNLDGDMMRCITHPMMNEHQIELMQPSNFRPSQEHKSLLLLPQSPTVDAIAAVKGSQLPVANIAKAMESNGQQQEKEENEGNRPGTWSLLQCGLLRNHVSIQGFLKNCIESLQSKWGLMGNIGIPKGKLVRIVGETKGSACNYRLSDRQQWKPPWMHQTTMMKWGSLSTSNLTFGKRQKENPINRKTSTQLHHSQAFASWGQTRRVRQPRKPPWLQSENNQRGMEIAIQYVDCLLTVTRNGGFCRIGPLESIVGPTQGSTGENDVWKPWRPTFQSEWLMSPLSREHGKQVRHTFDAGGPADALSHWRWTDSRGHDTRDGSTDGSSGVDEMYGQNSPSTPPPLSMSKRLISF